ncbi:uncharacterized protein LOC142418077 isoform X12 [Mycteria americana]|uniref:uncharacterized protein LOC142418077 isoform X12 n=1 Tax=Mycteria americana TaxID=33587 RepID=UPI003F5826B5
MVKLHGGSAEVLVATSDLLSQRGHDEERAAHVHGWGQQDGEGDSGRWHVGRGEHPHLLETQCPPWQKRYKPWVQGFAGATGNWRPCPPDAEAMLAATACEGAWHRGAGSRGHRCNEMVMGDVSNGQSLRPFPPPTLAQGTLRWEMASSP